MMRPSFFAVVGLLLVGACDAATGPAGPLTLRIEGAPAGAVADEPLPPIRVSIVDARDSVWRGAAGRVRLTVESNGQRVGGVTSMPLVDGVATFENLTVASAGDVSLRAAWDDLTRDVPLVVQSDWDVIEWTGTFGEVGVLARLRSGSTMRDTGVVSRDPVRLLHTGGSGEVVLFGKGFAPTMAENVVWTPGPDTVRIAVRPLIAVPLTVWAIYRPLSQMRAYAEGEIRRVAAGWAAEGVGLTVGDVEWVDAYDHPDARSVDVGATFETLAQTIGRRPGRMNIYCIVSVFGGDNLSYNVGLADIGGNQLLLGRQAWGALGHELAHNFGLLHLTTQQAGETNVMSPGEKPYVETFTEGQIFRAHFMEQTALRSTLGIDPGPARTCREFGGGETSCPPVEWKLFQ